MKSSLLADKKLLYPPTLKSGDTIAILAPAGKIKPEVVNPAVRVLEEEGYRVKVMPHTFGEHGSFSGTPAERLEDFVKAWSDPEVKAIICARGGYGVVHIMEGINALPLEDNPKWIAGFSDISALHALLANRGIASIHSSMTSHIGKFGADDEDNRALFDILRGGRPAYVFPASDYDKKGIAIGRLYGGNLAVLADLIDTRYNLLQPDTILFIEDVSEPIYKIERMMYQLRLGGLLASIRGLVVGQFTEYRPDGLHKNMEEMIAQMVEPYKIPVAFDAPVGHVDHNVPLIEGATVTLKVSPSGRNSVIFHK